MLPRSGVAAPEALYFRSLLRATAERVAPGVSADMMFVPRRGSQRRTCIPPREAEMPSGQQVTVAPRPWVGTTPWYQPTANEDIVTVSKVVNPSTSRRKLAKKSIVEQEI